MNTLFNETETAIVKVNASDYGLDSTKAQEIESMFTPMLEKMKALEGEYNQILKLEISPETCAQAKELRLKYVKVRTATAEIHKNLKDFYLKGGRFVDGWKNAQLFASQQIEETLKKIETHYEILEAERKEKLKTERTALIQQYVQDVNTFMLAEMSEDAFQLLLAGSKHQYEMRIAAEKKAEEDRIAREKAEAEERERIRLENIRLKAEADKKQAELEAERKAVRLAQEKRDAELALERAEAEKKRNQLELQARKEREERERIEAQLKAKQDAERKAEAARIANEKAEAKRLKLAPDKTKLLNFAQAINDLLRPEVKSIEAADIASKANIKLFEVTAYIRDNANKL